AHDADRREWLSVACDEARNDRVKGSLAAGDLIRMPRFEYEAGAAILQRDAGRRHDDAGSESHVVRLDQRNHHPPLIGRTEINGASAGRRAGTEVLRARSIDQLRA